MFDSFPKTRPSLPKEIEEIYSAHYRSNREGRTPASHMAQQLESWLHRQVAKDVSNCPDPRKATLEIGAGTLNQLPYEPGVEPYDVVEPFADLYKDSPLLARIRHIYSDIADVPISNRYDRITSIATLEHVCDLPQVVARAALLLAENGTFRASIPSEGTLCWTLGWRLTTGLEFKLKYGLDYRLLMKHEHLNTAKEIEEILEYFFGTVQWRVFGLAKAISLYRYYECRDPSVERCREYRR